MTYEEFSKRQKELLDECDKLHIDNSWRSKKNV